MLDFSAEWCTPCRAFYPRAQKLAKSYQGRPFVLLGIDVDTNNAACDRWRVKAIPAIFLIDAKGLIQFIGHPGPALENRVEELVKEAETKA